MLSLAYVGAAYAELLTGRHRFSLLKPARLAPLICRDKEGHFLGASAVTFEGLSNPSSLEAWACNEALVLARDLHIQNILIGFDCLEVATNIKKGAATVMHQSCEK